MFWWNGLDRRMGNSTCVIQGLSASVGDSVIFSLTYCEKAVLSIIAPDKNGKAGRLD
jgi:hypothetical protein